MAWEQVTLEKYELGNQVVVSDRLIQSAKIDVRQYVEKQMMYNMRVSLLGRMIVDKHVRWPATWWDAVKERWAPAFWLERHPVRYDRFDYTLIDALAERIAFPGKPQAFVVMTDHDSTRAW